MAACIAPASVIKIQSTLVISKSKGSLKYFEISVSRHIRFAELRKKINKHISQINM